MRRTPWRVVSLVLILGLAVASCDGPNRGSTSQPSSASGFQITVAASPNAIRGANAATSEAQGGCSTLQATVFNMNGQLVDGAIVTLSTTLGRFPASSNPTRPESVAVSGFTTNGVYTDVLCAKSERGTATVTASVEDAFATVLITIF